MESIKLEEYRSITDGKLNRSFLYLNDIEDGIMRKDTKGSKIMEIENKLNFKRLADKFC